MGAGSADFDVSVTLLGGVGLLMLTIYFLNAPDLRLRRYTWNVLNNTASFFIAVLFCSSAGDLLKFLVLGPRSPLWLVVLVNFVHLIIWLSVLTFGIAFISGALGEAPDPERKAETGLNIKCWGLLFGKVSSWAAIGFVGCIQQQVPHNLATLVFLLPVDVLMLCLIYWAFRVLRLQLSLADDNMVDEYEEEWSKSSESTEDAVMSVALSFQIVQVVRFWITGRLPAPDGTDTLQEKPDDWYMRFLTMWGCLFVGLAVVCQLFANSMVGKLHQTLQDTADGDLSSVSSRAALFVGTFKKRIVTVCQTTMSNCAAWCLLFFIRWWVPGAGASRTPAQKLTIAALVTVFSYAIIFILDKVANLEWTSEEADKELLAFITPFSLTIAFGWKLAFTAAVNEVTIDIEILPQALEVCFLTFALSIIFLPVWRVQIVQTTLSLAQEPPSKEPAEGYAKMP